jgi:hypothetical protein
MNRPERAKSLDYLEGRGLDIPHKSLNYKNFKMKVIDNIFVYLRNWLIIYLYHINPVVIGAHFN